MDENQPPASQADDSSGDWRPLLFVDLDHTLIATDSLVRSVLVLLRRSPWTALQLPMWAVRGRHYFKHQVAMRVQLDVTAFPYRRSVMNFVRQVRQAGGRTYLATAAHDSIADAVAEHLELFDGVLASNGSRNLKGRRKLAVMREVSAGERFDYIGDSTADLSIWQAAGRALVVNPSTALRKKILLRCSIAAEFGD